MVSPEFSMKIKLLSPDLQIAERERGEKLSFSCGF